MGSCCVQDTPGSSHRGSGSGRPDTLASPPAPPSLAVRCDAPDHGRRGPNMSPAHRMESRPVPREHAVSLLPWGPGTCCSLRPGSCPLLERTWPLLRGASPPLSPALSQVPSRALSTPSVPNHSSPSPPPGSEPTSSTSGSARPTAGLPRFLGSGKTGCTEPRRPRPRRCWAPVRRDRWCLTDRNSCPGGGSGAGAGASPGAVCLARRKASHSLSSCFSSSSWMSLRRVSRDGGSPWEGGRGRH